MCTVGGGAERGGEKLCVCVCWEGGQTARNWGNRGHEVSAEIKKKERKPPRKQPRDGGERVDLAGRRGDGSCWHVLGATQSTCGCQHLLD